MLKRKLLIAIFVVAITVSAALFAGKEIILGKFKVFLIQKIESASSLGIIIKDIGCMSPKGVCFTDVSIYRDRLYGEKLLEVSRLYLKFPLKKLIFEKIFSPNIIFDKLIFGDFRVDGSTLLSLRLDNKIKSPQDALQAVQYVKLVNLSVKSPFLSVTNINGPIDITGESIKISDLHFVLNEEPCVLNLEIVEPLGVESLKLKISSPKLDLGAYMKKEDAFYKIPYIKGTFLNSSFDFMGEVSPVVESAPGPKTLEESVLSLYGKANIDMRDILFFTPIEYRNKLETLNPNGRISSSVYFKGPIKDVSLWEVGVKSESDSIRIGHFDLKGFYMDSRLKDRVLNIPLLKAFPYNGAFVSSMQFDLSDKDTPYDVRFKLVNADIAEFLKNTPLQNARGLLSSEAAIRGNIADLSSMEGQGNIFVNEANLGPMPILTPLLGNLYAYIQHFFPNLKKIDITEGTANFYIADRKIMTENLVLRGDVVSVYAKGYIDFDKNLHFTVENQFAEPEKGDDGDWQNTLQEMIARFGKLASKAYLTGTLEKPKWKFEYSGGVENFLKGGLDKVLKDIFE